MNSMIAFGVMVGISLGLLPFTLILLVLLLLRPVQSYRWCTECLRPCDEDGYCDPCAVEAREQWEREIQQREKCCNCPSPDKRSGDEMCACGCRCHDPKEWRALKVGGWVDR